MHSTKLSQILPFFLLLSLATHICAQSPWTRSKGGFYAQVGYHSLGTYSGQFGATFDAAGRDLERELSDQTLQFYGEYGLSKNTSLLANVPIRFLQSGTATQAQTFVEEGQFSGLGNSSLAIRQRFFQKKISISGQLRVDLPGKSLQSTTGLTGAYAAWTIIPSISAGMGFRKAYWFAYSGYGLRTDGYNHFIQSGVEAGYQVKKFYVIAFSEWVHAMDNASILIPENQALTGLYVPNQAYISTGGKLLYTYNRFVGVGLTFATAYAAANLPKSPNMGVFAYFKWD